MIISDSRLLFCATLYINTECSDTAKSSIQPF